MAEAVKGAARNPSGSAPQRLIVGISGASGVTYGVRVLDALRRSSGDIEVRGVLIQSVLPVKG